MSGTESSLQGADALLSFTVENTLSYRDETTLSLAATRPAAKDARRDLALAGRKYPVEVLPAAGLFGANASGKSAILQAMDDMRKAVLTSFHNRSALSSIYQPFALDPQSCEHPSSYAVDIVINGLRWQYGFEIQGQQVLQEYAFYFPKGSQSLVFSRDGEDLSFGVPLQFSDGRILKKRLKKDALLLSTSGTTRAIFLLPLFHWFENNLLYAGYHNFGLRLQQTASILQDKGMKEQVLALIRLADLGITDIKRVEPDPDMADRLTKALHILEDEEDHFNIDHGENLFLDDIRLEHQGNTISAELEPAYESTGTMIWISMIIPVLDVLDRGALLLVDDLNANLHPDLATVLINLFQDPATNPYCAQLVFNSYDLTILDRHPSRMERDSRLGRDQIWFTEKDNQGVTTLHSLAEYGTRKNEVPYISYLKGRYGGLPVLDLTEIDRALDFERS